MRAKTAAKGMWILMGLVVLSAVVFIPFRSWQRTQRDAKRRRQSRRIVEAVKDFAEREGLYPKRLSSLPKAATSHLENPRRWSLHEEGKGTLFLRYAPSKGEGSIIIRLSFRPGIVIVDDGPGIDGPNSQPPKETDSSSLTFTLAPIDDHVARRTYIRLRTRLTYGTVRDCEEAVTYAHRKKSSEDALKLRMTMQRRFPNSRWARLAEAHIAHSRKKYPNANLFQEHVRYNPKGYADWFLASRLYLSKQDFYDFAAKALPNDASQVRDLCFQHVVHAAYRAKDYQTAIKFCEQWGGDASANIHAAALLASGAPAEARNHYEKYSLLASPRSFRTPLEKALIDGNTRFVLSDSVTRAKPFFPELSEFLIFPDL
ncbi:MAG: hypothetical protein P1V97_15015 [Planctomycetota bacterium]|nr:hypothetical protein [Planctomycetota bacterium]